MRRIGIAVAIVFALLAINVGAASAADVQVTQPSNPYQIKFDSSGKPEPFTVAANGFAPQAPVYVEMCNGRKPGDPDWSPSRDCDPATSQAPVYADTKGAVKFEANDVNRALIPVAGTSPQELFNCVANKAEAPKNGLPTFTTCQVRVASNPSQPTKDQAMITVVYGKDAGASSGSKSDSSNSTALVLVVVGVIVVAAIVLFVVLSRRNKSRASA